MLSQKDACNGIIVITDRFPLKDFYCMEEPMDGPRMKKRESIVGAFFSRREEQYYNNLQISDQIFVLQVDLVELRKRKTDLDMHTHKKKADAVNSVQGDDHIILIDANKPYADVLLTLKRKIWKCL